MFDSSGLTPLGAILILIAIIFGMGIVYSTLYEPVEDLTHYVQDRTDEEYQGIQGAFLQVFKYAGIILVLGAFLWVALVMQRDERERGYT